MKVEIYSDVVCPWCYIGERRFARALECFPGAADVDVVYRPYQLDPAAPRTAVPLMDYLEARFGSGAPAMTARVGAAAAGEGITIDWDRALSVNTLTAHRLLGLAERDYGPDVQRSLAEKLFDLHFSRGGDVADVAELVELAVSVGMDRTSVREHLESEEGTREVEQGIAQARRLGIQAVPTFVFDGRFMVQGAQPAAVFRQALEQVAEAVPGR